MVPFRDVNNTPREFSRGDGHLREYALHMSTGSACAVAGIATGIAAIFAFLPGLRPFIWPGIVWAIFTIAVIVALTVLSDILTALYAMYTGYGPEARELEEKAVDLRNKMLPLESQPHPSNSGKLA